MSQKPHQRRGLGRGLGSLIPTGPRPTGELREDGADEAVGVGHGSLRVQPEVAGGNPAPPEEPGHHALTSASVDQTDEGLEAGPSAAVAEPTLPRSAEATEEQEGWQAPVAGRPQVPAVAVPGVADWIGAPLPGDVVDASPPIVTAWSNSTSGSEHLSADNAPSPSLGAYGDPMSHDPAEEDTPPRPAVAAGGLVSDDHVALESESVGSASVDSASVDADAREASPSESVEDRGLRTVTGAWFAELAVRDISPNPRQPREVFDEESMAELVQSILEVGLLQPVVVRPAVDGRYELVMGERRWRDTEQAGLETIPAIVRETGDDALLRDALLENLHRSQLNSLEEAAAYQQLLEDFGCTHDELATRIGRSRPQISNTIRLLKLSPAVQRRVAAGVLSAGHARALLSVEDAGVQDRLAGRVVAEGISVRGLEEIVAVDVGATTAKATRRSRPTAPGVEDLAARLSDLLETRVKVDLGKRKGRITVEFASLPDLERIVGLIDPGHPGRTRHVDGTH